MFQVATTVDCITRQIKENWKENCERTYMYMYDLHAATAVRCGAYAASWYGNVAPLRIARCARDSLRSAVHCALGKNGNDTHMHNLGVCACYMYMAVARRIATGAQRGCVWCGLCSAYAVAVGVITHGLLWRAVHVQGPYGSML